ncbi:hypothetical protein FRC17_000438 [Serendipita sp. 399]|nr:hypothetical protein FRC17_000438 [Serendipita sp. 399]
MGQDLRRVGTLVLLPPLIALTYVAAFAIAGFSGFQIWLENVEMAAGDISPWGWELESEDWTGGPRGGTDPALGFLPRFALRSAWFFQHWTGERSYAGRPESSYVPTAFFKGRGGDELAERQVAWTIQYLLQKQRPIPPAVLLRHEELLERLGTPPALNQAWNECLVLLSQAPKGSLEAARLSLKLGNLAARMGFNEGALRLWKEALTPLSSEADLSSPITPAHQRHLADVYLQLSSFSTSSESMTLARDMQRLGSDLIANFLNTIPSQNSSSEERLHHLYLLHRRGVLGLQHAEIELTTTSDTKATLDILHNAAHSARTIVDALCTGAVVSQEDRFPPTRMDLQEPIVDKSMNKAYSGSKTLRAPAGALLRDARRTAMQAHLLEGALLEGMSTVMRNSERVKTEEAALQSYRRALTWAGTTVQRGTALGIPQADIINIQQRIDRLQAHLDLQAS